MNRIKKFVKDHQEELATGAAIGVGSVFLYSYLCGKMGYRMTRPLRYDDDFFYVKTITGRELKSPKL